MRLVKSILILFFISHSLNAKETKSDILRSNLNLSKSDEFVLSTWALERSKASDDPISSDSFNHVLIKSTNDVSSEALERIEPILVEEMVYTRGHYHLVSVPSGLSAEDLISFLRSVDTDFRDYASMDSDKPLFQNANNRVSTPQIVPPVQLNDPLQGTYLSSLGFLQTYQRLNRPYAPCNSGTSIRVGILDSGVESTHPDLQGQFLPQGIDVLSGTAVTTSLSSLNDVRTDRHGTQMSGVLAATGNNGQGIAGAANEVCGLVMRVANASGATTLRAYNALVKASLDFPNVKIFSFSYVYVTGTFTDMIQAHLFDRGAYLFWAAGNSAQRNLNHMNYSNIVVVGAHNSNYTIADFSNFGTHVDLLAPGVEIPTTLNGGYSSADGTSLSAPIVAGAVAGYWAARQNLSLQSVVTSILNHSYPVLGLTGSGARRLNLMNLVASPPVFTTPIFTDASILDPSGSLNDQSAMNSGNSPSLSLSPFHADLLP